MISPPADRVRRAAGGWLLAVDPGLIHPAAAAFRCGELAAASRVRVPRALAELDRGERVRQIAALIHGWWWDVIRPTCPHDLFSPDLVVAEFPQAYSDRSKSKNSANQLMPLAAMGVAVASMLGCEIAAPLPAEWIGQVPKNDEAPNEEAWNSPRGRLIRRRLRDAEIPRVALSHDSVDATGIGLWSLGRLERTYPGAV